MLSLIIMTLLVTLAVLIHYEILRGLSILIPSLRIRHRIRVLIGVFGSIVAHIIEVMIFGGAFYLMLESGGFGHLEGNFDGSLADCIYFSFTNYTTVGYGDIEPHGSLRFLSGIEAITGLSLITWSASFMFMEMTQFWEDDRRVRHEKNKAS